MAAADKKQAPRAVEVDEDPDAVESGYTGAASELPTAVAIDGKPAAPPDPSRWLRRGLFVGVLALGWLFILWQNRFYFTAPTVFVCLGFLALVSTVYALWRTGVVVVAEDADEIDSTWGRPIGRRSELEREKKTLLKAIKEAEFDREMGKLSKVDAEQMIAVYRMRAIEVIKEIDQMDAGSAGTVREQIEREVKARLELDTREAKAKADAVSDAEKDRRKKKTPDAKDGKDGKKAPAKTAAEVATEPAQPEGETAEPADDAKPASKEATS